MTEVQSTEWYQVIKLPTNAGEFPISVYLRDSFESVFTESLSLAMVTHVYYATKYPANRYIVIAVIDNREST